MAEAGESTDKKNLTALLEEAKAILNELKNSRGHVDEQLKATGDLKAQGEGAAASLKAASEEIGKIKAAADESFKTTGSLQKKLDEGIATVSTLLEEIQNLRVEAEQQLKATEASRKKADDDASYAYRAKVSTEEHANVVSKYKGDADSEFATITLNKQKSEELVQAITAKRATCEEDAKVINDQRKSIEQGARTLAKGVEDGTAKLKEIVEFNATAATTLKEAQGKRDETIQARNTANAAGEKAEQSSTQAETLASNISELHSVCAADGAEIDLMLKKAKTDEVSLAKVLEHLQKSDSIATNHEERVEKLSAKLEALVQKVESLLPGATSAGLASAFNKQRDRFGIPQRRWLWAFVTCIAGLVAVAAPGFIRAVTPNTNSSWGEIFRELAMRLPIVIPLVWLGIYAGRNYMLSLRLEEEYTYKEAVSTAFEGYKREMESIAVGDAANPSPLTTLCINILRAIAERPGRIYEGKHQDITPFNEAKAIAEKAQELGKKTIAS